MSKFISRKFLMSLFGAVTGVATALSTVGGNVGMVAGLVLTAISIITYIINESKLDSANRNIQAESQELTEQIAKAIKLLQKEGE